MFRNARARLIGASVALSVGVSAILLVFVYTTVNSIIATETRSVVEAELAGLSDDYRRLGVLGLAAAIERRIENSDRNDAIYLLADARGRTIVGNLAAWPPTIEPGGGWVELELIRADTERTVPVSAASLRLQLNERLLVGRDASALRRFDNALYQSAIWALLGALGLSLFSGLLLTRLVFSRLSEISRTADSIINGDLDRRVPLRGTGDEFDQLSTTLNQMLDRINSLIDNLRFTTSSLSHDLRSPLTRLRTRLESLSQDLSDAEHREQAVVRSLDEVDRLLKLFHNLTEIARAEARISREEFSPVNLAEMIVDAVELYEPVAEEAGVTLAVTGSAGPVPGHRHLLMQALSNLLENALRVAPETSTITVSLESQEDCVELSVADEGCGLSAELLHDAAKVFVTGDQSRSEGGTGLGLALVSAVARLHDGELKLQNTNPGLRVTISLIGR